MNLQQFHTTKSEVYLIIRLTWNISSAAAAAGKLRGCCSVTEFQVSSRRGLPLSLRFAAKNAKLCVTTLRQKILLHCWLSSCHWHGKHTLQLFYTLQLTSKLTLHCALLFTAINFIIPLSLAILVEVAKDLINLRIYSYLHCHGNG